jgi:hypothetical protein
MISVPPILFKFQELGSHDNISEAKILCFTIHTSAVNVHYSCMVHALK